MQPSANRDRSCLASWGLPRCGLRGRGLSRRAGYRGGCAGGCRNRNRSLRPCRKTASHNYPYPHCPHFRSPHLRSLVFRARTLSDGLPASKVYDRVAEVRS
jgi:hypothetical protein